MTEGEWHAGTDARALAGCAAGAAPVRTLRLFMVGWCRLNWDRITLPAVRDAVELAERFADGLASKKRVERAFEEYRRVLFGTPIGYLLWPDGRQMAECVTRFCTDHFGLSRYRADDGGAAYRAHQALKAETLRDVIGNPFRPPAFDPAWRTATAVALAKQMYAARDFAALPILADALQDAGCDDAHLLGHCRSPDRPHVRGCWVVDSVLGNR